MYNNIKKHIKNIALFEALDKDKLDFISSISTLRKYEKNSILYFESDCISRVYFLIDGQAKAYKIGRYDKEVFLYYISPYSMITQLYESKSDTIKCFSNITFLQDSLVLSIDYKEFKNIFFESNGIYANFIEHLMQKNEDLQRLLDRELIFDTISKVAHLLSTNLEQFNNIKRYEASNLLNIQPETLSRTLKKLSNENLISESRGRIQVNNFDKLKMLWE